MKKEDSMYDSDAYLNHILAHHVLAHNQSKKTRTSWILLDSQSTVDVFTNPDLLEDIRDAKGEMMVHSHGGSRSTKQIGDLPGYPDPIWYDPDRIVNILSLSNEKNPSGLSLTVIKVMCLRYI